MLQLQWNLVIKRSHITKPCYNKVILLVPSLYNPDVIRNLLKQGHFHGPKGLVIMRFHCIQMRAYIVTIGFSFSLRLSWNFMLKIVGNQNPNLTFAYSRLILLDRTTPLDSDKDDLYSDVSSLYFCEYLSLNSLSSQRLFDNLF